jgi:aryl-alcohol dehydrogenase-like predicted oxidoreductase
VLPDREDPPPDYRRFSPRFVGDNFKMNLVLVREVESLARAKGCTPAQLALAWVLSRGEDVVPIPGAKTRAHLEENAGALEVQLNAGDLQKIERVWPPGAAAGLRYPQEMMGLLNG